MPIPGARFRVKTEGGQKVRLAFKDNEIVEAKNLKTGATHTPAEFAKERKGRKMHRRPRAAAQAAALE
jgi:hypothetical protein